MTYFVPVRKIVKILWAKNASTKRDGIPLMLTEGLDKNTSETRLNMKLIILIFIVIIIHYLHSLIFNDKNTNITYRDFNTEITKSVYLPKFKSSEDANASLSQEYKNVSTLKVRTKTIPTCFLNWTSLGKIHVNKTIRIFEPEREYPTIRKGGYYHPQMCKPRHKVAILVPYRNREKHLGVFLYNIHPFLMRQKIEYRVFVIEQKGTEAFNRGKLFNVGYLEMKKFGVWHCVVFHDVDLLPLDERILYSCPTWPRHMCATVAEVTAFNYRTLFGGVASMRLDTFEKVNGYSNLYWGWGGEDNDMFWRLRYSKFPVVRYNKSIAQYTSLKHSAQPVNRLRYALLSTTRKRYLKEGLSTVDYKVKSVTLHHLYTRILVDINLDKDNKTDLLKRLEY